jgi:hypothetical protein
MMNQIGHRLIISDDLLGTLLTLVTEWYVFHDEMFIFVIMRVTKIWVKEL